MVDSKGRINMVDSKGYVNMIDSKGRELGYIIEEENEIGDL